MRFRDAVPAVPTSVNWGLAVVETKLGWRECMREDRYQPIGGESAARAEQTTRSARAFGNTLGNAP